MAPRTEKKSGRKESSKAKTAAESSPSLLRKKRYTQAGTSAAIPAVKTSNTERSLMRGKKSDFIHPSAMTAEEATGNIAPCSVIAFPRISIKRSTVS